ncbi:hypothetical protein cypCar_00030637, partial [Cyprinus carpio]
IATRSGNALVMNPWDPITYTVTPAAKILARCVTSGTMTQVKGMLPCNSSLPTFRKCCKNRQSYERDSQSHCVSRTSPFRLIFTGPVHLIYVVELMGMVVEFIQNLEVKIKMVQAIPTTDSYLSNLNNARTQLLSQVTEVENLYKQVLKRRGHLQTNIKDTSI